MNKILNEMPAWNDNDKVLGDLNTDAGKTEIEDTKRAYTKLQERGKKPVYSQPAGEFTIELYEAGDSILGFVVLNGSPVGFMRTTKTSNGIPIIVMMYVENSQQGKGLGMALYNAMIKQYGGIISDKTLTGEDGKGGSYKVWEKLGSIYPNNSYVVPMNQWGDDFNTVKKVNGFTRDMMGNRGERFMICTRSECEKLAGRNTKKIQEIWSKGKKK